MFTLTGGCSSLGGVLKCRFYYHLAIVRPIEQEMAAIGKVASYLQFPRGGFQPCCSGHMGSTQVGQRHREQGGNLDKSPVCNLTRNQTSTHSGWADFPLYQVVIPRRNPLPIYLSLFPHV